MQSDSHLTKESNPQQDKIYKIAEILGLLDEANRGKDWLIEQIKKHKIRIPIKITMNSFEILKMCPPVFVDQLRRVLRGDDIEGFEDVKTLTKTYHWFFTDIVAGSNPTIPTKDQVRKIIVLNELISRTETFRNRDPKTTIILPTGDGMAIGFPDSAEKPLRFSIELHKFINRYNESRKGKEKLQIRIGIDMGPVYFVKDLKGQDNVWGPGLILTRRVMDLAEDMQILASARITDDIRKLAPEYKAIMHPIGDYTIKHGEYLSLYNIYGDGFGNKIAPRKAKLPKRSIENEIKNVNNFKFNSIEVLLDVTDTKSMLTHHTWIWNLVNIAREPKYQIFYYLDGDSPKEFSDMNVTVKDDRGNKLDILSVNTNKPHHKEFNVQLNKALLPKQKKILKLEYDWEEPERTFFYKMASNCKEFKYTFTADKNIDLRTKVLKVDTETGYKALATPPPKLEYVDGKTRITWNKTNLRVHDAYQFFW